MAAFSIWPQQNHGDIESDGHTHVKRIIFASRLEVAMWFIVLCLAIINEYSKNWAATQYIPTVGELLSSPAVIGAGTILVFVIFSLVLNGETPLVRGVR